MAALALLGACSDGDRATPITRTTPAAPTTTLPSNRDEVAAWFDRARPTLEQLAAGVEKVGGELTRHDAAALHQSCTELDQVRTSTQASLLPVPVGDLDASLRTALERTSDFVRGCLADDMRVMGPLLEPLHDRYEDILKNAALYSAPPKS